LKRGLEGDQSYYTKNLAKVQGKKRLEMGRDPAPDLSIEIDVTRSSVNRMAIYARLKVAELWRYDGVTIRVFLLDKKGNYREVDESPTFPGIPIQELVRFLRLAETKDDNTVVREFRAWVRKHLPKKRKKSK
jgi:Uma2 family endonuclease